MISRYSWLAVAIALMAPWIEHASLVQPASLQPTGPRLVRVVAHDFAFELPDVLPAGATTIRLENEGKEPHHLMLYRLDAGHGLHDVFRALSAGGAHPDWMHAVGGPNAVPHGGVSIGTVLLVPGVYVAFCHVKSPDQRIHFSKGMLKSLTVTPSPSSVDTLPTGDLTITLRDYAFDFSQAPTRGRHRIAIHNAGTQPHELILSRLRPGKTARDFINWMNTQEGPSPVTAAGGATDLPAGGTIVIDVVLEPGSYSVVCRVRDEGDGRPHDEHGMYTQFVVR